MVTQDYLIDNYYYCKKTGIFSKIKKDGTLSKKCGTLSKNGYIKIIINSKEYKVHRLIFLYLFNCIPKEVDHKNRVRSDNRFKNLRSVTKSENSKNKTIQSNNKSGVSGVFLDNKVKLKKWRSQITSNGKVFSLGRFFTFKEAVNARIEAEKKYNFKNKTKRGTKCLR